MRETAAHLYASSDWIARNGRPARPVDLNEATFIGFDQSDRLLDALNGLGMALTRDNFRLASENGLVAWEMVKRGLGVGVMIADVADLTPCVERLLPDLPPFAIPVWLATHRELHTSRRIRLVFDLLADALAR